jgi:hypothetical protein
MRDPRDNIRSILDRLQLPGSLERLDLEGVPSLRSAPAWRLVLDSRWLGFDEPHYIDALACRWNHAADAYLQDPQRFILVRYEDFLRSKRSGIEAIAAGCGFRIVEDITAIADAPYQRRGNAGVDWKSFFGATNLERIEARCADRMSRLGYGAVSSP